MPAAAKLTFDIDGLEEVEVNPFGPLQLQLVAPLIVVLKFNVLFSHTGLLELTVGGGGGQSTLTVTVVDALEENKSAIK